MERQTIKKPLNGSKNNIPKETTFPLHYMGRPFEQKNTMKDASFSSYLRPDQPPPTPKPEDNNRFAVDDSDQISVFEAENYFSEKDHQNSNKGDSSIELNHHEETAHQQRGSEFSAISRLSSVSSTDGYGYGGKLRTRSFHATPTASSEASWNSQTGLLSKPPGAIPISLRNIPSDHKRNGGYSNSSNGTKWFLGLKCPCYGKSCVQVEENFSEQKIQPKTLSNSNRHSPKSISNHPIEDENQSIQSQKYNSITKKAEENIPEEVLDYRPLFPENNFASKNEGFQQHRPRRHHQNHNHGGLGFHDGVAFSFPILNQSLAAGKSPVDEPPRESLEVFQPPVECTDVQQRRGYGYPTSPMSRMTGTEEDGGSDASSDLFEIDGFSNQTTSYRRRDSLDDASAMAYGRRQSVDEPVTPSVAATECYEPSEASINWSVTTAEGFDRGSVTNFSVSASEFGDVANMRRQEAEVSGGGGGGGGWSKRKSGGGGGGGNGGGLLLSCRWEKAVSVGPTQQQGKWVQEDGVGGGGGRRVVGGGGGGPPLPMISTMRHVSSRPYKR